MSLDFCTIYGPMIPCIFCSKLIINQPSGIRSWIQRLVVCGRRRALGLGSIPFVSLAEAREKAIANRKVAREGGDPVADKRRGRGMPTFAEAAERPPSRISGRGAILPVAGALTVLPLLSSSPLLRADRRRPATPALGAHYGTLLTNDQPVAEGRLTKAPPLGREGRTPRVASRPS